MATQIRDLMTQDVVTLAPDMTLQQVDRVLLSYGVSGAPVVEDGVLVGVLSRADVIQFLYGEQAEASKTSGFYTSPFPIPIPSLERLGQDTRRIADHIAHQRVREIMSKDVRAVAPGDGIQDVAARMAAEGIHRMPVLDGNELVGIITSMDLVKKLATVGLADG